MQEVRGRRRKESWTKRSEIKKNEQDFFLSEETQLSRNFTFSQIEEEIEKAFLKKWMGKQKMKKKIKERDWNE
jgi:predicted ribosome quality control (RQC) complex YloA/Tae2 family protein